MGRARFYNHPIFDSPHVSQTCCFFFVYSQYLITYFQASLWRNFPPLNYSRNCNSSAQFWFPNNVVGRLAQFRFLFNSVNTALDFVVLVVVGAMVFIFQTMHERRASNPTRNVLLAKNSYVCTYICFNAVVYVYRYYIRSFVYSRWEHKRTQNCQTLCGCLCSTDSFGMLWIFINCYLLFDVCQVADRFLFFSL